MRKTIRKIVDKLYYISCRVLMTKNDSIQAKRVLKWFEDNGDRTCRLNYDDLTQESIVFDLGGFEGQWASDIYSKYNCKVLVFEPYIEYANSIRERFKKNPNISVFDFGLSDSNKRLPFYSNGDASSSFNMNEPNMYIDLKAFSDFIKENNINKIDLMKVNIEGGEYDLLEGIIRDDVVCQIKNIQVQFHDFHIPNAKERMEGIQKQLSKSHRLSYQYHFVWENWVLN